MERKYRKYTFEEKLQAAKMHVEEGVGCTTVANKFNCDKKRVLLWSRKYQEGGEEALRYETRGRAKTGRPKNKTFNSIEEELEYVKAERDILKKTSEILKKAEKKIRFQVIFELKEAYKINFLCSILKVSESGYYKWLKNKDNINEEEMEIVANLKALQIKHKYGMGSERMTYEYERIYHKKYNHKRIARLMRNHGLQSVIRPKNRRYGISKSVYTRNKLGRNFSASSPYDKLSTDISEFKRSGKKVYLSIIKDLYTHVIEALEISYTPSLKLVIDTINQVKDKAIEYGTFFHSDQGFQYTNPIVQKILKDNNFLQSMSRKGTPIDNAPTESFFSTLKSELIYNKTINISNDKALIQEIIDYIYYYNNDRIQKSLGYLTPIEFKKKYEEENHKSN